ncbi:major facilitator superfamily domain-containing protein [Ilyonectria robusta]|uniref:major facilitator superfamily domain-containing protein n=1 Tax=Ilyonectria robusta TaxID=1079257 RepID=UPI001E8D6DD4|nr:major facilitator superfamily domain-containing protein [Ilyonectria robusta]KAH8685122.1 major facilitator superfamily domain-containing protein [Ilyonectria robusta]
MVKSETQHVNHHDNVEALNDSTLHHAAERGQAATDKYGQSLVQYDPVAERRLRLKIDLYIIPTVSLLYLFCFIDRANIGNAKIAGLDVDLGMEGYDYNVVISVFYISYILFEIPANLLCKWMGPGWFLPLTTLLFGVTSLGTGFVKTIPQACGVRFLLGIFEAGMMPGIAYYLSRWYRRSELVFRLSLYIVMAPLAGAFGGLLASAILTLDNFGSLHRWRMIFALEGIITIALALVGFLTLTDRPASARWLSEEEKDLAIARVKSERVGTTVVLDKIDKTKLLRGILSPMTLSTAFIFLLNNVTVQGLAFFAPTIVKTIYQDKTTIQQQLYTVPPYVVGAFFTVLLPLISWRIDRRQIFFIMCAPMCMVGYCMFLGSENNSVRYGATFLIASSCFALGPLTNAQVSANVVSDTARSAAIGMNVMMGNIGGLIAGWSFLPWDAPNYHIGNGLNLATSGTVLIVSTLTLLWMKRDNKKKDDGDVDEELSGMTPQQIEDLDWKHPAFRWRP